MNKASSGDALPVAPADPSRGDLHDVYAQLRQSILSGALAPGDILNQVHIAKAYGVSRTPVREALRMLQAEGLVEAQFQHRMRVTDITPQEVDSLYATWILVQCLGAALCVPRVTTDDLAAIRVALRDLKRCDPLRDGSSASWNDVHMVFHRRLMMHAGPVIIESIENCWSRTERARRTFVRVSAESLHASEEEHEALVEAYESGSISRAVEEAGSQLARVARMVIGNIDPSYEPVAVRQALLLTQGATAETLAPAAARLSTRPFKTPVKALPKTARTPSRAKARA